ncbi:MAG: peptidase [Cyanobacteria bacterium RYN_339]|nr:peptidase [Cyanobacteria bacterium RYN_339]
MKHALPLLSAFLSAFLLAACQTPTATVLPGQRELVIRFQPGLGDADKARLREASGVEDFVAVMPDAERWRLRSADDGLLGRLSETAGVKYAQRNNIRSLGPIRSALAAPRFTLLDAAAPNDPGYAKQWHLPLAHFPEAWTLSTGRGVVVATVDSGVDPGHPDLRGNLLPMLDEVVAMGGHDTYLGQDFDGRDSHGHGTHVAGIIGASANNRVGITGAAPDVKILPVKVTDHRGEADDAIIARGVVDAVDRGARVVNLSIGGAAPSPILLDVINYAFNHGATMVIAAGNESAPVDYPAAYRGVIAVGGVTAGSEVGSYSNHGDGLVLVAPGGGRPGSDEGPGVFSTIPTYACTVTELEHLDQGYDYMTGTSMAAPQVTAAVALLLAREPLLSPAQIWTRLASAAHPLGLLSFDERSGYGLLDANKALRATSDDGR